MGEPYFETRPSVHLRTRGVEDLIDTDNLGPVERRVLTVFRQGGCNHAARFVIWNMRQATVRTPNRWVHCLVGSPSVEGPVVVARVDEDRKVASVNHSDIPVIKRAIHRCAL